VQEALDALQSELLSEIIALRAVAAVLLKMALHGRPEPEKQAAFDLCLSVVKNAKLGGFTPEDELMIRATAEQKLTAILMARVVSPDGDSHD